MSNFTYAFLALVAGGLLFLRERVVFISARASTQQLQTRIGLLSDKHSRLEQRRSELERRLAEARELARTSGQASIQAQVVVPPNPDWNGGWPTNEPYFYLPKRDLPGVGFFAFMTNPAANGMIQSPLPWTNRLSDDTAIVFGLTSTEREAVNDAYLDLWEKLRQRGR
jgi:hypothetical protein